jgi:peroxiredoxin Q/BCP
MFRLLLPIMLVLSPSLCAVAQEKEKSAQEKPAPVVLKTGEKAPGFTVNAFPGGKASLKDYDGKWLVLVFYPKAFAPKDASQMKSLSESWPAIKELNAVILGVSMDPPAVVERFQKEQNLPFALASDDSKAVSAAYGAVGLGKLFSSRRVFFIDPKGRLAGTLDRCPEAKYGEKVVEMLKALQAPAAP